MILDVRACIHSPASRHEPDRLTERRSPGSAPDSGPAEKTPPTVTLAPGTTRPAGLTVSDLGSLHQLQERFNNDQGAPRLVLALAPT
jgi:hypothetical protein